MVLNKILYSTRPYYQKAFSAQVLYIVIHSLLQANPIELMVGIASRLNGIKERKKKRYDNNTYPTACCLTNVYFLEID